MNEQELRWQLRQLPREMDASRDLWPGIEARLGAPIARSPSSTDPARGLREATGALVTRPVKRQACSVVE